MSAGDEEPPTASIPEGSSPLGEGKSGTIGNESEKQQAQEGEGGGEQSKGSDEEPKKPVVLLQPNATLYVSNIDWSLKKNILRRALLALFERHGKVLEVITLRREGLRGQAWIIFEDIASAISAQRSENGFRFFGKELKVDYALEKSDRIAKRDGTYVPKDRRIKRNRKEASGGSNAGGGTAPDSLSGGDYAMDHQSSSGGREGGEDNASQSNDSSHALAPPPPPPPANDNSTAQGSTANASMETVVEEAPPSNILFAEDLPTECNEMMLAMLFRQYVGYQEVRIPRAGLAFIEFDDEPHATLALRGLNGFHITSADTLNLKYSK